MFAASSLGLWGGPQAASAEAAVLLRHAATVAARAPVLTPSADQFIFVKSVQTAAVITNDSSVREQTDLREVWASVAGTRVGPDPDAARCPRRELAGDLAGRVPERRAHRR